MEVESQNNTLPEKIKQLEEDELRLQDETTEHVYKLLLIHYLLDDQPIKAKFLWKRIPSILKTASTQAQSELFKVWTLSQFLIERKYTHVFAFVNQLEQTHQWSSEELKNLVTELVKSTKQRIYELINLVYISISVQEFANMLGISTEEAVKIGLTQKWTLDDTKMYLLPFKKQNEEVVEIPNKLQMQQLTNLVSFLEAQ